MSLYNLKDKSCVEISNLIADGKLDPIELTEFYLDRILNVSKVSKLCYVEVTSELALKEAYESSQRVKKGRKKSIFDGIPCAWKDMIDCTESPAKGGSKLLAERTKKINAKVFINAKNAGMPCLGKTATVEFALGGIGTNKHLPFPYNMKFKDIKRAPGGSSSGSAAAVSSGLSPIAVGTDTGGSVRIPATWHSLVGFKPSFGSISNHGVLPLAKSFDTVGPISKNAEDALMMYNILSNKKIPLYNKKLNDLKIAVCISMVWDDISDEDKLDYYEFISKLSRLGIEVIDKNFPEILDLHKVMEENNTLIVWEAWNQWKDIIEGNENEVDPNVMLRMNQGKEMEEKVVEKIKKSIITNTLKFKNNMSDVDCVIMPSVPIAPPSLKDLSDPYVYSKLNNLALRNTRLANILNMCSISIPLSNTRPTYKSAMLCSTSGNDYKILNIASSIQKNL